MRVIQLRHRRLLTTCALSGLSLMVLYLLVSSHSPHLEPEPRHRGDRRGEPVAKRHISHPGVVPRFLGMCHK